MKVAILGCGPAGLFAAHAAIEAGADVTIHSKPRKSFMRGAQYLHRPIPGLSQDPFEITYGLVGTIDGYRDKVYGAGSDVLVSPKTLIGKSQAWDIREAYDAAWDLYHDRIREYESWNDLWGWERTFDIIEKNDLVISTIPAKALCADPNHRWKSQKVWVTEYVKSENLVGVDNVVVCSGDPDDWWYRQSVIQGWENTEFPYHTKPNSEGKIHEVEKPIATDCDCFSHIVRMGRYGAWKKGVLSDSAYYETRDLIRGQAG